MSSRCIFFTEEKMELFWEFFFLRDIFGFNFIIMKFFGCFKMEFYYIFRYLPPLRTRVRFLGYFLKWTSLGSISLVYPRVFAILITGIYPRNQPLIILEEVNLRDQFLVFLMVQHLFLRKLTNFVAKSWTCSHYEGGLEFRFHILEIWRH